MLLLRFLPLRGSRHRQPHPHHPPHLPARWCGPGLGQEVLKLIQLIQGLLPPYGWPRPCSLPRGDSSLDQSEELQEKGSLRIPPPPTPEWLHRCCVSADSWKRGRGRRGWWYWNHAKRLIWMHQPFNTLHFLIDVGYKRYQWVKLGFVFQCVPVSIVTIAWMGEWTEHSYLWQYMSQYF